MMSGLVIGRVIKVGEPPPVIKTTRLFGKKDVPYAGFSGISGSYWVELDSAQTDAKSLSVRSAQGFGLPDTKVDNGNYVLPFQWESDPSVTPGSVTIDLESYYVPKDNNINRRRALKGTLVSRSGRARMKTAYVVDINESGYPELDDVPELLPYHHVFWDVVFDIAYNSRQPLWNDLRLRYSKMLCAAVDLRIAEGGVSS